MPFLSGGGMFWEKRSNFSLNLNGGGGKSSKYYESKSASLDKVRSVSAHDLGAEIGYIPYSRGGGAPNRHSSYLDVRPPPSRDPGRGRAGTKGGGSSSGRGPGPFLAPYCGGWEQWTTQSHSYQQRPTGLPATHTRVSDVFTPTQRRAEVHRALR